MRHGRYGVVETRLTTANGDEETQKHAYGSNHRFGPFDPLLPSPFEYEVPEGCGPKSFGLFTERVQQSNDRQTIALEGGVGCSPMRPHPGPKGHKEFRLRTWQSRWGRWRDVPRHLKEAHKVACAHKEMAIATTGVVQALEVSQVLTKRLQGVGIQRLQRQASCLGPV